MGRCIYGGIWAEMLEDRKFWFPVAPNYNPYGNQVLTNEDFPGLIDATEFPVVSASPWEMVGEISGLVMDTSDPFVGRHTPRIKAATGIRQNDLGVKEGMNYPGYLWAKPVNGPSEVEVKLTMGADHDGASVAKRIRFTGPEYTKAFFELISTKTLPMGASLEVRVIEGEILLGTLSLMPGDHIHGMRRDTIELLRQLNSPLYRWPGGNFVSGYNWRDGIGDRDRRPPRRNPAWTGVEHNDFGTDEFIAFCRLIGAEPMIAANTGFGDAYSAAQWVEYTNGAASSTIGGGWRAANGSVEPFGVKYWCVGNEMWGDWQLGHMQLHHYVLKHNEFAEAMRAADPSCSCSLRVPWDISTMAPTPPRPVVASRGPRECCWTAPNTWTSYPSTFMSDGHPGQTQGEFPLAEHLESMRKSIREKADGHRTLQRRLDHLQGRTFRSP
jgi:alpha-L-arabinofuranosidase